MQINLHNLLATLRHLVLNIALIQKLSIFRHSILVLSNPNYMLFVPNTSDKVSICSLANSINGFVNHSILFNR